MKENRKFTRLREPMSVTYRAAGKSKTARVFTSCTLDISGGGMRIEAKNDLRCGDLLEIDLEIPGWGEPVEIIGEVIWYKADKQSKQAGILFRDIEPREHHAVLDYIYHVGISGIYE